MTEQLPTIYIDKPIIEEPFPCDVCSRQIVKGDHVTTDNEGYYHTICWKLKKKQEGSKNLKLGERND